MIMSNSLAVEAVVESARARETLLGRWFAFHAAVHEPGMRFTTDMRQHP